MVFLYVLCNIILLLNLVDNIILWTTLFTSAKSVFGMPLEWPCEGMLLKYFSTAKTMVVENLDTKEAEETQKKAEEKQPAWKFLTSKFFPKMIYHGKALLFIIKAI